MAFGSRKPSFRPSSYGYKRRRRGIPRWLLLLITGVIIGAGGVIFLQRSYGPQLLTAEQSEQLRMELNSATIENQRLQSDHKKQTETISKSEGQITNLNKQIEQLREDNNNIKAGVSSLIKAIPADPRGGNPGIRSADMVLKDDGLNYKVLLIQNTPKDESAIENIKGKVKLIAIGSYSNGNTGYVDIGTEDINMSLYTVVQGVADLPKGFRIRQVTIQVTNEGSDKVISTRTIRVTKG